MDRAYNKTTDKTISAFEIYKNGSYQNLKKGEWLGPKDSIHNYEEISEEDKFVHYVSEKEYTNKRGKLIWCSPCFAVYPGSLAKTVEETPAHKLLKNWLFERLSSDDMDILFAKGVKPHKYENKYKLSQLDINWNDFEVEVHTKGTKRLRADILLPFNTKHQLLGEGIIFEIQLSSQSEEETHERTIERALHGYSVCWLFEKDFIIEEDNITLKNNTLMINSFSEQMHFAKKGFVKKLKHVVEEQCRFLDEKISESNLQLNYLEKKKDEVIAEIKNSAEQSYKDATARLNTREALLIKKIETLEGNPFLGLIDSYKQQLDNKLIEIEGSLAEGNEIVKKNFEYWKAKLNYPTTLGICPKCNKGYMTKNSGKFGPFYSCSNWNKYGTGCNHIVNIRDIDNG